MDVWLGHFAVQQKLTEHCKSTIIKKILKKCSGETHWGVSALPGTRGPELAWRPATKPAHAFTTAPCQ